MLPLWTLDPLFYSSSKESPGDGFKPSGEEEKKDTEGPENEESEASITEEPRVNQEKDNVNNTNKVNVVSSTVNAASNEVNVVEADLNNMETTFQVSPIPITRIHKDYPVEQIVRDIHSSPQTRRMAKNVTDHDFVVYQMDVKSVFLYGKIKEEVYVCQPLGFEDPEFPDRVYKIEKALYGLL
nr:ribonuclease H-like domain, reverse transcriptase, RNA-dependent DNA polymerase [Tanacetum cinerariifolium]